MKSYILFLVLTLFAVQAKSQMRMEDMFPKTATYYIKDGPMISYGKIDSVIKSWGGKFNVDHKDNNIYLYPSTPKDLALTDSYQNKANELLNKPAADFTLKDLRGKLYTLSQLKGKVVVLNFWFTSCAGCVYEMPELNKIEKRYKGKNVAFFGLGRDHSAEIIKFLKKYQFDYTLLPDADLVATTYGIDVYPTSLVIDKNGLIKFIQVGVDKVYEHLTAAIDQEL